MAVSSAHLYCCSCGKLGTNDILSLYFQTIKPKWKPGRFRLSFCNWQLLWVRIGRQTQRVLIEFCKRNVQKWFTRKVFVATISYHFQLSNLEYNVPINAESPHRAQTGRKTPPFCPVKRQLSIYFCNNRHVSTSLDYNVTSPIETRRSGPPLPFALICFWYHQLFRVCVQTQTCTRAVFAGIPPAPVKFINIGTVKADGRD